VGVQGQSLEKEERKREERTGIVPQRLTQDRGGCDTTVDPVEHEACRKDLRSAEGGEATGEVGKNDNRWTLDLLEPGKLATEEGHVGER
jgi:hypothetical protein